MSPILSMLQGKKAVILIPVNLDALLPHGLQNKTKKHT